MRGTEFLTDLTLRVGTGSDHFAMSHGSFKYKRSQSKMRLLIRDGERFIDQKTGSVYRLHRECLDGERKGILHLWFTRESGPDTENRFDLTIQALPDEHIYGCGETYWKDKVSTTYMSLCTMLQDCEAWRTNREEINP